MNPERYAQIKKLFFTAMEVTDAERVQFLRDQCGDDEQLRQEVESLLAHESSQTIISSSSDPTQTSNETRANSSNVTLLDRGRAWLSRPRVPRLGTKGQWALGSAIAMVLLLLFGFYQRQAVNKLIKHTLQERLNALVDAHVETLEQWLNFQQRTVEARAVDSGFQQAVIRLVALDDSNGNQYASQLQLAPEQSVIRSELRSAIGQQTQYIVLDAKQRVIASGLQPEWSFGKPVSDSARFHLAPVYRGETVIFLEDIRNIIDEDIPVQAKTNDIFVAAPIRNEMQQVIAVVVILNPDTALVEGAVWTTSRITETSEAYAFNAEGRMLTESRFDEELRRVGILGPDERSAMNVVLRDPGVELTRDDTPATPLDTRPLTHMARYATAGHNGIDIEGYRNYLGTPVVGAWRWMPQYKVGVVLEMAHDEAYRPLRFVERQFIMSFLLLTASVIGILLSAFWIAKLRRQVGTRQLGQYTLDSLIGEGGMGQVFKAHHAMLKRACALKLLKPDQSNPRNLAWFEREVQAVSVLSHPNTIQIYDYGATPEGNFFYVMELLRGMDLERLAVEYGPIRWSRVVYLLRQICLSLREAHDAGLVHRDIKPQNIMICQLGGEFDFVKVLDFGLVKKIDPEKMTRDQTRSLAGTPMYMPPERWRNQGENDPRSDIYSLGAVAYRLLSGREIYSAASTVELVQQIISTDVVPFSRLDCPEIPLDLQQLVMSCLSRDIASRPNSVVGILEALQALPDDTPWDQAEARQWWADNGDRCNHPADD